MGSNYTPRVNIGMPVYNGERFLEEAIDSMLNQSFKDFELIISDNASTDRTQEICRAYLARDRRIRYFQNQTNLGATANFNRVFELSSGEYFKLANADDLSAPDLLAKCVAVLDAHPEVVLCYPKTTIIDENGDMIRQYEDNLDLRISSATDRFRAARQRIGLVNVLQGLIRSNALRRTSLMGNFLASDVVLVVELTLYGQFYEIPQRLFFRRIHPQAASSITSLESKQEFIDPKLKGKPSLCSWRRHFGYLASIMQAPLTPTEKARLAYSVFRWAVTDRENLIKELSGAFSQIVPE